MYTEADAICIMVQYEDWPLQIVLPNIFNTKQIKCDAENRSLEHGAKCFPFVILVRKKKKKAKPKVLQSTSGS